MIQRIQTVYLLAVAVLLAVCACMPVGAFITADYATLTVSNLCVTAADGTRDYSPWALMALLAGGALLALVTIFLFRRRMLQIRLTIFNTVLLVGYYATLVTFVCLLKGDGMTYSASWTVCLPAVCIVLNWLAIRGIGKDEVLVRAYDRLR